jgi:hypothetical protein
MSREEKAKKVRSAIIKIVKTERVLSANDIRVIVSLERIVARLSSDPKLDTSAPEGLAVVSVGPGHPSSRKTPPYAPFPLARISVIPP